MAFGLTHSFFVKKKLGIYLDKMLARNAKLNIGEMYFKNYMQAENSCKLECEQCWLLIGRFVCMCLCLGCVLLPERVSFNAHNTPVPASHQSRLRPDISCSDSGV